jgi:hypothetical protein
MKVPLSLYLYVWMKFIDIIRRVRFTLNRMPGRMDGARAHFSMINCSLEIKQTDVLRDANRGVSVLQPQRLWNKSSFILINDGTISNQYFSLVAFEWSACTSEIPMITCRLLCMQPKIGLLKQGKSIGVTYHTRLHVMPKLRIHGAVG